MQNLLSLIISDAQEVLGRPMRPGVAGTSNCVDIFAALRKGPPAFPFPVSYEIHCFTCGQILVWGAKPFFLSQK